MAIILQIIFAYVLCLISVYKCQVQYNINSSVINNVESISVNGNTFYHFHASSPQNITDMINEIFRGKKRIEVKTPGRSLEFEDPTNRDIELPRVNEGDSDPLTNKENDLKINDEAKRTTQSQSTIVTQKPNEMNRQRDFQKPKFSYHTVNENQILVSDDSKRSSKNEIRTAVIKCFPDKSGHSYLLGQSNYVATQLDRINGYYSGDLPDLQREIYIILILKFLNDRELRHSFNDSCLIESYSEFNSELIKEMSRRVIAIMTETSHRKKRDVDDSSYLDSIIKKTKPGMIKELMDSGLILKTQQDAKRIIIVENTTTNLASFDHILSKNDLPLEISFHPLLDWPEALNSKIMLNKPLGMNGPLVSLLRASQVFSGISRCTGLFTWREKKSFKVNVVNLISIEKGKLCSVSAYCESVLYKNYTCKNPEFKREKTILLTNFEHQAYTEDKEKIRTVQESLNKKISNYEVITKIDDIEICSIKDIYENHNCSSSSSYFGQVNFYYLNNGLTIVSPLVENDLKLHFNSSNIDFYECSSSECSPRGSETCSGDSDYCSKIAKCSPGSFNKCRLLQNLLGYSSKSKNSTVLYKFSYWTDMTFLVDPSGKQSLRTEGLMEGRKCTIDVKCDTLKLYLNSSCAMKKLLINTGNHDTFYNLEGKQETEINLNYNTIPNGLSTSILLFDDFGKIYESRLDCDSIDVCQLIKCTLCKMNLINPQCMGNMSKTLIIVIVMVSIVMLVASLYFIYSKGPKMSKKMVVKSGRKLFKTFKDTKEFIKSTITNSKNAIMDKTQDEEESLLNNVKIVREKVSEPRLPMIRMRPRAPISPVYVIAIAIGLFPGFIRACVDSTTLTTSGSDCTISTNGKVTCLLKSSVRISGAPIGQESCININGQNGEILSYISIKTEAMNYECKKNYLYHTAPISVVPNTKSYCPGTENCESWEQCTRFLMEESFQHSIFPSTINVLSKFDCSTPNGCAGNGCWRCDNGCSYASAEIHLKGDSIYEVSDCPSWIPTLSASIKFHGSDNMDDFQFQLNGNMPHEEQGLKISLISHSEPMIDHDFCILKTDSQTFISSCQKSTELITGSIGEIRCPTKEDAMSMTSKCIMAPSLITMIPKNWDYVIKNRQIDMNNALKGSSLPVSRGSSVIDNRQDGAVVMRLNADSIFEIQIDTLELNLSIRKEKAICFGTKIQISGCYSCISGATMSGEFWSSTQGAIGLITCGSSISMPIIVNKEKMIINKTVLLESDLTNLECELSCNSNKVKLETHVKLIKQVMLNIENKEGLIVSRSGTNQGPTSFFSRNLNLFIPSISIGSILLVISILWCFLSCSKQSNITTILPLVSKTKIK